MPLLAAGGLGNVAIRIAQVEVPLIQLVDKKALFLQDEIPQVIVLLVIFGDIKKNFDELAEHEIGRFKLVEFLEG